MRAVSVMIVRLKDDVRGKSRAYCVFDMVLNLKEMSVFSSLTVNTGHRSRHYARSDSFLASSFLRAA